MFPRKLLRAASCWDCLRPGIRDYRREPTLINTHFKYLRVSLSYSWRMIILLLEFASPGYNGLLSFTAKKIICWKFWRNTLSQLNNIYNSIKFDVHLHNFNNITVYTHWYKRHKRFCGWKLINLQISENQIKELFKILTHIFFTLLVTRNE